MSRVTRRHQGNVLFTVVVALTMLVGAGVMALVLAASGAKYAAGEYEWWNKGSEGTLINLTTPDADPIACTEISETP